ncbi:MAG: exodeoxyribonuclease V subunit beta [Balneolaceae bacterium]
MSKPLQNIFDLELSPRLMIEASAGTGKTYTIVGIFVRLLIENKVPPEQILVVTFTRMATRELKDRVMLRLRESLAAIQSGEAGGDAFLGNLISWSLNFPEAESLLQNAIRNFDDAQIFTIHGFSQKVLVEEALLTGAPFEVEISQSDDLLQEAASDFWRTFVHRHSPNRTGRYYLNKVFEIAGSPAGLIKQLYPLLDKPYAGLETPEDIKPMDYLDEVLQMRGHLKELWMKEREEILDILRNCGIKRYGGYLDSRMNKLESFLNDETLAEDKPDCLNYFTSGYLYNADLKKDGKPVTEHSFFELCENYGKLLEEMHRVSSAFLVEAAEWIRKKRDERAADSGFYSYDDLLNTLCKALQVPESGKILAERLQGRYPFALVDEFQDTDPVQYEIFDRIYSEQKPGCSLMMIGDPKQAIYAFRGADVYAYLNARDSVHESGRYTLKRNFRSSENLINGVNALFSGSDSAFIETGINFLPSETGLPQTGSEYKVDGKEPVPVRFRVNPGITNGEQARDWAFGETAREVAELISKGNRGEAFINSRPLTGGDIAILISSHKDAADLKQRLHNLDVDAVTYSREMVFHTAEASRLEILMSAVLDPADPKALKNVLMSGFFGNDLNRLYTLRENEQQWQNFTEILADLNEQWQKSGFYPLFRKLMMEYGALRHFTEYQNSERIITNLQQLAELCAFAERDQHLDGPLLLNWFRRRMTQAGDEEEDTLRLESDQDLVKISTIHNSKGLEFPVVFCPSLWHAPEVKSSKKGTLDYHNEKRKLVLNLDQSDSENRREAYNQHLRECVAEEVRKTYVALTRAKYECRIYWTAVNATPYSGLGTILTGSQLVEEFISNKYNLTRHPDADDTTYIKTIHSLAESYPVSFTVAEGSGDDLVKLPPEKTGKNEWNVLEWKGKEHLLPQKKLNSFSSLMHHDPENVSEPDYDQWLEDYLRLTEDETRGTGRLNIFTFPRGAAAGTVIHKLFEHDSFDFRDCKKTENREFIAEVLKEHGVADKWIPIIHSMMTDVCQAEIGDINLSEVAPEDQLREMEFHLPVSESDLDNVLKIIRNGAGSDAKPNGLMNYLTGFIDLIVRQNGKYYILDYKSNHLGDSVDDYHQEALAEAVESAGYDLQYHFYTLALVKMLERKITGFRYDRDFGGAAYLFIRGMKKGSPNGVWFQKPREEVIRNLDAALERSNKKLSE